MRETKKVFVAGSGTMGMSIAQAFADKLYDVTVYDIAKMQRRVVYILPHIDSNKTIGVKLEKICTRFKEGKFYEKDAGSPACTSDGCIFNDNYGFCGR